METALLFDTLKTSKHLQAAGFEQEQAEALTEEFKSVVESNFAKLSTKEQISSLETNLNEKLEQKASKDDIQNVRDELKDDIQNVRDELKDVKDELKEDIYSLKGEQKLLKWMVGFGISLNLVTLGVVLAFLFSFLPPAK